MTKEKLLAKFRYNWQVVCYFNANLKLIMSAEYINYHSCKYLKKKIKSYNNWTFLILNTKPSEDLKLEIVNELGYKYE